MPFNCAFSKDIQADYDKNLNKIELLMSNGKYEKAKNQLINLQNITQDQNEKDKLNIKLDYCKKKIQEEQFWQKYLVDYDKYENQTWYSPASSFFVKIITPKILEKDKRVSFKAIFLLNYSGSGWIFADKITLYYNGKTLLFIPFSENRNVSCNSSSCYHTENLWVNFTKDDIKNLEEVVNSNDVSVKFSGKSIYEIKQIDTNNLKTIKNMIELYNYLENKNLSN